MTNDLDQAGNLEIAAVFEVGSLNERLEKISQTSHHAVFTTSLSPEDQVITHVIAMHDLPISIITLDTGRHFPETLQLLEMTEAYYDISIERFTPDPNDVRDYITDVGEDGFYDSIENRKRCCYIRKVAPLNRALKGADAWITGMRRGQSDNRSNFAFVERSPERNLLKFNPIIDWTTQDVWEFVNENKVPTSKLHELGYPSIGCAPCTRAVKSGEHERAGRWWWEQNSSQECGLHTS